ncbi:MAG: ATP-dependent helicase [Planctomycetaceae bacterium]|nr:ATP-dependent helicase [Planctomycetaceae bacterium]
MSAFDRLAQPIRKWIRGRGWREMRDIQVRATEAILGSEADVIVAASTAGGKTESAFLPLLSDVIDRPSDAGGFDLLYIGPLKALITDQAERLTSICEWTDLPVTPWHGDVPQGVKGRAIKAPGGVLLITPESLEALFVRRGAEIARLFAETRAVVLDEMHTMLGSERGVQVQSLLTRIELARGHRLRRVGLSATLGDMDLARAWLHPDDPGAVLLLVAQGGGSELRLQVKGFVAGKEGAEATERRVAADLFTRLRGTSNLVFAGSRGNVETFADHLRQLCETQALPQEFFPHHASLSREHRSFLETRLKKGSLPTTAVCTSTLELGIDIGDVTCVAQVGAPFSVAALRQRMGRSGRRAGAPAILRQYAIESAVEAAATLPDRLRLGLVRAIAMIDLLLKDHFEPPATGALHLSTLVHQILSVIAERGGTSAARLHHVLCRAGPFRAVDAALFGEVLRALGRPETALIEQAADGLLLLGREGEKIVEHHSFYAVFQTPKEYRLFEGGHELGTLPVEQVLAPGMLLLFSGRRWRIMEVDDRDKVILLTPSLGGKAPVFGSAPGIIHDMVVARMFALLEGQDVPIYLDETAADLLAEARAAFRHMELDRRPIIERGPGAWTLATRAGTALTATLALALQARGFTVAAHDGFLEADSETRDIRSVLEEIRAAQGEPEVPAEATLAFEKFHPNLTRNLLLYDALSARLKFGEVPALCSGLLSSSEDMSSSNLQDYS